MTKVELQQRLQAQIDLNIKLREQNSILQGRVEALQFERVSATSPAYVFPFESAFISRNLG